MAFRMLSKGQTPFAFEPTQKGVTTVNERDQFRVTGVSCHPATETIKETASVGEVLHEFRLHTPMNRNCTLLLCIPEQMIKNFTHCMPTSPNLKDPGNAIPIQGVKIPADDLIALGSQQDLSQIPMPPHLIDEVQEPAERVGVIFRP